MNKPKVVVGLLNVKDLKAQMNEAAKYIGLERAAREARAVFIKPNLTYPSYKKGVTTSVDFVKDLVDVLVKINQKLKIYLGDGEGGYNAFSMTEALKNMGFFELQKRANITVVNLSECPWREISIETLKGPYRITLPEIFFTDIDLSISCPVPKVHAMTRVSLSYKNIWGCLPDVMRLKNHYMFSYIISKIADILKFRYAFLDGQYGLTRNGPMVGDPIEVNWFAASNSLGAFDAVVSEMMDLDWKNASHLKVASEYGFIPERADIEIQGDISSLKRSFVLKRNFWNYPALFAFHSKRLTHLFYFSKWAKLLHDIMYTFRKRPITHSQEQS